MQIKYLIEPIVKVFIHNNRHYDLRVIIKELYYDYCTIKYYYFGATFTDDKGNLDYYCVDIGYESEFNDYKLAHPKYDTKCEEIISAIKENDCGAIPMLSHNQRQMWVDKPAKDANYMLSKERILGIITRHKRVKPIRQFGYEQFLVACDWSKVAYLLAAHDYKGANDVLRHEYPKYKFRIDVVVKSEKPIDKDKFIKIIQNALKDYELEKPIGDSLIGVLC